MRECQGGREGSFFFKNEFGAQASHRRGEHRMSELFERKKSSPVRPLCAPVVIDPIILKSTNQNEALNILIFDTLTLV
jgi:hypothetical protein